MHIHKKTVIYEQWMKSNWFHNCCIPKKWLLLVIWSFLFNNSVNILLPKWVYTYLRECFNSKCFCRNFQLVSFWHLSTLSSLSEVSHSWTFISPLKVSNLIMPITCSIHNSLILSWFDYVPNSKVVFQY